MTVDSPQDGDPLDSLATLRAYDVSPHHARRLRHRCHARLQPRPAPVRCIDTISGSRFWRVVVPALGAVWCVVYVVEIIRFAAAVYRGTQ